MSIIPAPIMEKAPHVGTVRLHLPLLPTGKGAGDIMPGKLVRLGIIVVTLVLGIYVLSGVYKNFSHLMVPDQDAPPAVDTNAPKSP